jgi:hypothetical protein
MSVFLRLAGKYPVYRSLDGGASSADGKRREKGDGTRKREKEKGKGKREKGVT